MEAPNRHTEQQKIKDILGSVTVTFYLSLRTEPPQTYRENNLSAEKLAPELVHNKLNKKDLKIFPDTFEGHQTVILLH